MISAKNIYNNNILQNVYQTETSLGKSTFKNSINSTTSGVIPPVGFNQKIVNNNNTGYPQNAVSRESNQRDFFISPLSGQPIAKEGFHDNMVPFIKNKNQQNLNADIYSNKLGRFTGNDETRRKKKVEVKSFFDLTPDNAYVYGSPSFTSTVSMDRYIPSQKRQNEKPFQDIRVGPGLAAGYTAEPSGGLNQANARAFIMPKTVDELRVLTKPKTTYEGRVVAGQKPPQRGLQAAVNKNRPETFYNSTPERGNLSAAVKASQLREKFYMKPTQKEYQKSYFGGLGQGVTQKPMKSGVYRKSTKNNYMNPTNRNMTTAVKKLITPITDFFRRTRKENFIGNIRPEGNMSISGPSKPKVYDPNDIARTTIKEQTIDNDYLGQLSGEKKNIVWDPNDIARTTIKEQNIHNTTININMNPQQPRGMRVYDPEDIARTTMKEVTIDNDYVGIVGGQDTLKPGGYTSTSVDMKSTNRQFLTDWYYQGIADGETGTGPGRGYLATRYEARNTNRQFLNDYEYNGGSKSAVDRPASYDSMYNAHMNPNREEIALGREPTLSNVKLAAGGDMWNLENQRKLEADRVNIREPAETLLYSAPPQKNMCGLTQTKSKLPEDTIRHRMDSDILDAFRENPYTKPLDSYAYN